MKKESPILEKTVEECLREFERGYMRLFSDLPPEGREYMRGLVDSLMSGDTALADALYAYDYEHRRVPPEVFFTHSDYLGHFKEDIYQAWLPHMYAICSPRNRIYECVLTGSLGIGKTTIGSGAIMAYKLHEILCLKDPARFYGLGKKSKIIFGIYSLSLEAAEEAGFFVLRDQMLADSPFFSSLYQRSPFGTDEITFPKNVIVKTGSKGLHAAGKNLFAICVDEMNLMAQGKSTISKAFDLANTVSRRLESRFMQRRGEMPGICVFLGSAASESSFIERRVQKVKDKPGHYVVRGALWDFVHTDEYGRSKYSGKTFRVQVGNEKSDSKILDKVHFKDNVAQVEEDLEPDMDCQVVDIPVEHFSSFEVDVDGSLQDLAGVSSKSMLKLFTSPERVLRCFNKELLNPFVTSTLSAYLGDGTCELRYEFDKNVCRVEGGRYVPRRHPEAPRYIHIDLAKNQDRAGISMVHPSSHFITVEPEGDEDGLGLYDVTKYIEADFSLAIEAGPQKESIDFANIRRLVFFLRRMGYWIRQITMDWWQSEDSLQRFQEVGLAAEVQSLDREITPYMMLRNVFNARRISVPSRGAAEEELLYKELIALDFDQLMQVVDHPPGGSKDMADGLCGAVYRCLIDKIRPSDARRSQVNRKSPDHYKRFLGEMRELCERYEI